MRYDEYLARGLPIASGPVEGACKNLIKDRMERSGMRWTPRMAEAMRNRFPCLGVAMGITPKRSASHREVMTGGISMIPQPVQK